MTATPNLWPLWDGYITMLAAVTGKPVDLGRVPDTIVFDDNNLLVDPYVIVNALIATQIEGAWASPHEQVTVPLQHSSIGRNPEQAQRMADRAREAVLARNANGLFTNPITAPGVAVICREPTLLGGPVASGGGLWEVVDGFDLDVTVG